MHLPPGLSPVSPQFPLFGHPEHDVQFYSDDEILVDGIEKWRSGKRRRSRMRGTKKHQAALAVRLKVRNQGMTFAAEQGRYLSLDVADVFSSVTTEGTLDEARACEFFRSPIASITAVIERGKKRVVVFGETVALLWAKGKFADVLRLEQLWNDLARVNKVSVRCGYPIQAFHYPRDHEYFRMICEEHSAVIAPEGYPGLAGEAGHTQAAISPDQLLARERRLLESNIEIDYRQWQSQYRAAVLETDRIRLFKRVEIAQAAVLTRLHELQSQSDHHAERHQLMQAWRVLQIIKRQKLGFFE